MKIDMRCMQETIRKNIACAKAVTLHHMVGCECQTQRMTISHVAAVVINAPSMGNHCPCGLPKHQGECRDAARAAQGLEPIIWRP